MSQLSLLCGPENDVLRTADISEDGRYRYALYRTWGNHRNVVTWIMLNPSTADHQVDDPTIRRCVGFAHRWGYSGIVVGNLYALRATDPSALWAADDPIGRRNDRVLRSMFQWATTHNSPVIAAWGVNARPERAAWVREMAGADRMQVLALTKDGQPRHPLYMPKTATPLDWPGGTQ